MSLKEIAKSYLLERPDPWLNLVTELCFELDNWRQTILDDGEESQSEEDFSVSLFQELLSPELIIELARSRSSNDAENRCAKEIMDSMGRRDSRRQDDRKQDFVPHEIIIPWETSDFDPIIDVEFDDEMEDDANMLASIYLVDQESDSKEDEWETFFETSTRPTYNQSSLEETIAAFLEESNIDRFIKGVDSTERNQLNSVFRLDILDAVFYQTLVQHPDLLRSISWRTFERLLADILNSFGYEIELQRGTKDGGVDLFAIKKNDTFGAQRVLLQAKHWSNKVGIEPVRQLAFLHSYHRVTKSCLATTATFTQGAWELARQYEWHLELRDFKGIHDWIIQAAKTSAKF